MLDRKKFTLSLKKSLTKHFLSTSQSSFKIIINFNHAFITFEIYVYHVPLPNTSFDVQISANFYFIKKCLFNLHFFCNLCLTDHSVRYIVFHRVLVFLATPMCYIPFERVFDVH